MPRLLDSSPPLQESLEELGRLADTAGLRVVGTAYQMLDTPHPSTYVGQGKVNEVARAVKEFKVRLWEGVPARVKRAGIRCLCALGCSGTRARMHYRITVSSTISRE